MFVNQFVFVNQFMFVNQLMFVDHYAISSVENNIFCAMVSVLVLHLAVNPVGAVLE